MYLPSWYSSCVAHLVHLILDTAFSPPEHMVVLNSHEICKYWLTNYLPGQWFLSWIMLQLKNISYNSYNGSFDSFTITVSSNANLRPFHLVQAGKTLPNRAISLCRAYGAPPWNGFGLRLMGHFRGSISPGCKSWLALTTRCLIPFTAITKGSRHNWYSALVNLYCIVYLHSCAD